MTSKKPFVAASVVCRCGTLQHAPRADARHIACYACGCRTCEPTDLSPPPGSGAATIILSLSERQQIEVELAKRDLRDTGWTVLAVAPLMWSGWECDTAVAAVEAECGTVVAVVLDGTTGKPATEMLRERLAAYRQATELSEAVLAMLGSDMAGAE